MLLRRILAWLQGAILDRPVPVLIGTGVLLVIACVLSLGVEFRTSRSDLSPPGDPEQRKLDELVRAAGGDQSVIACVERLDAETTSLDDLRSFTDRLTEGMLAEPRVGSAFSRIPLDWFLERGLYLESPDEIEAQLERLDAGGDGLGALAAVRSLAEFDRTVADGLQQAMTQSGPAGEDAAGGAERLVQLIDLQLRLFSDPEQVLAPLESDPPLQILGGSHPALAAGGYLATRDGSTLFVILSASDDDDSLPVLRELIGSMRAVADRLIAQTPGYRVSFTGQPAMAVEEMDTIRRDTAFTSIVAILGVSVLTFLVFRWRGHALLVLLALVCGVTWALGWVGLRFGYLNMITSSCISTLVGVGVAYGIHPISEYELEGAHTRDPRSAVREAYSRTGAPVAVAAITTAAAFLSIQLMQFRGFAELGLVAGIGVLLCLVAAMVALPAMVVVYGNWRHRRDRSHRASVVDRFWVERAAGSICRFPRTVVVVAGIVTLFLGWSALRNEGVNTNLLELLPRNSEALEYQQRMIMESELSPVAAVVAAADLDELLALSERAAAEPAILRFESALDFIPRDVDRSREIVARVAGLLDRVELPERAELIDAAAMESAAWALEESLALAAEEAFGAGMAEVAGPLEEARERAEQLALVAASATPAEVETWNAAQQRLLEWLHRLLADLRDATVVAPPAVDGLPPGIDRRFRTADGRLLGYLQPRGSVFDPAVLEEYVAASRRVSEAAFGFPIVFHRAAERITTGFQNAVILGGILVFVILLIDYRNLRDAGLAMIPLVLGVIWMLGWMQVFGISFNLANLVAVPLIIGVGIDNGVHVVHRLRLEGAAGMGVVLRHTGRAILIASLTTMIGFGSLALASHRGLESLGLVLLLGVGSCLITSTLVLPNLLVAFGKAQR